MINDNLAYLVYDKGLRQTIKKHYEDKYEKRIDYLVGANNELMKELEQYEKVSMKEKVWKECHLNRYLLVVLLYSRTPVDNPNTVTRTPPTQKLTQAHLLSFRCTANRYTAMPVNHYILKQGIRSGETCVRSPKQ